MKIGLNTSNFPKTSVEELLDFVNKEELSPIEIVIGRLPFNVSLIGEEGKIQEEEELKSLKEYLQEKNVSISSIGYYTNPFHPDEEKTFYETMKNIIDIACQLGSPYISTFTGYSPKLSMGENFTKFKEIFSPILEYAQQKEIYILIENTPILSGDKYAGNFAYSPEVWDTLFTYVPHPNLGLNYNPSHLFWLGIDYMLFLRVFINRIKLVQGQDTEILVEKLRLTGILGDKWFRYRICGSGSIQWNKLIPALYEAGYDGVISINNVDPIWMGDLDRYKKGIILAKKSISPYIV